MNTISTLHIPVGYQLFRHASNLARRLKSTDIDLMCIVAFVLVGLVVTFYQLLFGSFSQEISGALSDLSQGLLAAPSWDDAFLG